MLYLKTKERHEKAQAVVDRYNDELTEAEDDMLEHRCTYTIGAFRRALSAYYAIVELLEALELGGDRDDEDDEEDYKEKNDE